MKIKSLLLTICILFVYVLFSNAQVTYTVPEGGWSYIFNGDVADTDDLKALDGTWSHENSSDQWDGTEPLDGNPGGVVVLEEVDTFLRIQDTGDPRATFSATDPSNRKICFHHLFEDSITSGTILDSGITLAFRVRIPSEGLLDEISNPDDNTQAIAYPGEGDGCTIAFYGKGMFTVFQTGGSEGREQIGFSLTTLFDNELNVAGLVMNSLTGNVAIRGGDVDFPSTSATATINALPLDPLEWNEFWIQIKDDASGEGTHAIKIWANGVEGPFEYHVTSGIAESSEAETSYIAFGSPSTGASGAMDIDYIAYKEGIIDPLNISGINNPVTDFFNPSVYPNPFNNNLRISAQEIVKKVTVTNMMGVELFKTEVNNTDVILNLENLKNGLYILQIEGNKGYENHKIIKN